MTPCLLVCFINIRRVCCLLFNGNSPSRWESLVTAPQWVLGGSQGSYDGGHLSSRPVCCGWCRPFLSQSPVPQPEKTPWWIPRGPCVGGDQCSGQTEKKKTSRKAFAWWTSSVFYDLYLGPWEEMFLCFLSVDVCIPVCITAPDVHLAMSISTVISSLSLLLPSDWLFSDNEEHCDWLAVLFCVFMLWMAFVSCQCWPLWLTFSCLRWTLGLAFSLTKLSDVIGCCAYDCLYIPCLSLSNV